MRQLGMLVGSFGLTAVLALTGCKSTGDHEGHDHDHAACCGACGGDKLAAIPAGIEAAHGKDAYDAMGAAGKIVMAEFDVDFGGGDLLAGTMWFDTQVGQARMELDNDTVVVFDGEACWVSDDAPEIGKGYRFHALTWPYFLAAPFKLSDPGVTHTEMDAAPLTTTTSSPATKMTFGEGVGDAPDDWYVVFPNPQDGSLAALAYIVTYDMAAAYAEAKPSIVFYTQPETVEGATFATELIFHFWDEETGVQGEETKGVMTVSEIAFVDAPADAFVKFDGAVESTLPSAVAAEAADAAATEAVEEQAADDMLEVTEDASEATEDATENVAEEASEMVEEAAEGVSEAAEEVVEAAEEAMDAVAETAEDAVEEATEVVTPAE
ncbi:MAG: hypothetical protein AAGF84_09700 [Planctomycetota bacterium]